MIEGQERRNSVRVPYLNSLSFKLYDLVTKGPKANFRQADIIDICSNGVRIKIRSSDTVFEIGSTLCLKIPFPRMPVSVTLFGKVKWLKIVDLNTRQAGIEFLVWE